MIPDAHTPGELEHLDTIHVEGIGYDVFIM